MSKYDKMTPEQLEAEADKLLAREDRMIQQKAEGKYKVFATKISADEAVKFENICNKDGLTPYEMIQMLIAAFIRFKDPKCIITSDLNKMRMAFEVEIRSEERLHLTDPSANVSVKEATYFLGDNKHKGMRLKHVYQPFLGEIMETENIKEILDRTIEEMPVLYEKLKVVQRLLEANSLYETLIMLTDAFYDVEDQNELENTFSDCERDEFGRKIREHHRKLLEVLFNKRQTCIQFPEWTEDDQIKETF